MLYSHPECISHHPAAGRTDTRSMLRVLALSLGLDPAHFTPFFTHPMVVLRPLHYDATVSQPGEGLFGAGAHTDYGLLTFLATDDVPGLQINAGGGWVDVPPRCVQGAAWQWCSVSCVYCMCVGRGGDRRGEEVDRRCCWTCVV